MGSLFTSLIMLIWYLLISGVLGWLVTQVVCSEHKRIYRLMDAFSQACTWPVIVLAPLLIMLGFRLFATDLTFPSSLTHSHLAQGLFLLIPASILVISSGFLSYVFQQASMDHRYWLDFDFVKFGRAIGKSTWRQLGPIVFIKSLLTSWSMSLPWVFGELIVIESICNIPGVGYSLWMATRQRNLEEGFYLLALLLLIYSLFAVITIWGQRWLGEKLAGY